MIDINNITPSDETFTSLFRETLAGLYEDLREAETNCKRYEKMLEDNSTLDLNLSVYGPLLNDSLKIKAAVKDKIIKVLANLKDRVRTKEQQRADGKQDKGYSESDYADMVEEILKRE